MPDSIFRPAATATDLAPASLVRETPAGVIVHHGRTPADLAQEHAARNRKALTIVLSIAVGMVAIVAVALLLILLS